MNKLMRPEDDDIDSRDKPCRCNVENGSRYAQMVRQEDCPKHGIAASNARQNRYWQRVGRD